MAKRATATINEAELTKGHLRKLTALRKSLGQEIADDAFVKWLAAHPKVPVQTADPNARMIEETLLQLVNEKGLRIPKPGYIVRRGRGRMIVEPAAS